MIRSLPVDSSDTISSFLKMTMNPTEKPSQSGQVLFSILTVLASVFLLTQLSVETKFSSGKQLFSQPRFWPGVAVFGMLFFGVGHLLTVIHLKHEGTLGELVVWLKALEYLAWFMVYVVVVPYVGYLPATVLFTCLLALRQGYRTKKHLVTAALLGVCIVLVFKTGLSVKIPGGELYDSLPSSLRNFMIVNF
ncbi:MAG: hypothetical protein ACI9US_002033 [Gammaproteobacteria bacterium]|jgi:hypothetical protein